MALIQYDGYEPTQAPHQHWASLIPCDWVNLASSALKQINPFVSALEKLHDLAQTYLEARVILFNQSKSFHLILF